MAETERSAKPTTDHEQIRRWVEEREGWPARVKGTGDKDDPGMIRIDFPGYSGQGSLERISWEEWFEQFEENNLALLIRDFRHEDGDLDRFNKIVSRKRTDDRDQGDGGGERSRGEQQDGAGRESGPEGSTREYLLKEREYRGPDGEIHHHTNAYMQQHEGEGGKGER